jgi:hypothetical protein
MEALPILLTVPPHHRAADTDPKKSALAASQYTMQVKLELGASKAILGETTQI